MQSMAKEQEQTMKPLAESAPQANRSEQKQEDLSQLGKAAGTVAQLKPLGLRYSFVVRGTDGQEQEVDAAAASKSMSQCFSLWKPIKTRIYRYGKRLAPQRRNGYGPRKKPARPLSKLPLVNGNTFLCRLGTSLSP